MWKFWILGASSAIKKSRPTPASERAQCEGRARGLGRRSGRSRHRTPDFHRRERPFDQDGAASWLRRPKGERCRRCDPARSLEGPVPSFLSAGSRFMGFSLRRCFSNGPMEREMLPRLGGKTRCWRLPCAQATSSSWTIWPSTRWPASRRLLKPAAPSSVICRPTVPTSIRSKMPSAKLKAHVQNRAARTLDALGGATTNALPADSNPTIHKLIGSRSTASINRNLLWRNLRAGRPHLQNYRNR